MTDSLSSISSSWRQAPWDSRHSNFIFQLNTCGYCSYVTSSLARGWVCRLQLLLVLASAVILRSESRGTHDILLSQIRDSPNLEGQVTVFISSRDMVARIYPQALDSLFVASYDSQGYGARYISSGWTQQKTPFLTVLYCGVTCSLPRKRV
jgi:hypothetical protein